MVIEEMKYEYWLDNIKPLTNRKKRKLWDEFGSAQSIYYIEETKLQKLSYLAEKDVYVIKSSKNFWDIDAEYQRLCIKKIDLVTCHTIGYPKKLLNIDAPPYALYIKGKLPEEEAPAVAIIGARKCSLYGEKIAKEFAEGLAECGVQIISGMARGIDGVGQKATLRAGGNSYGILAGGVDICYPMEHIELYMQLQENGGVISEQSIGQKPIPQYFPARNRIISGLSDAVIVIEAREKSGTLITVDRALEQGKEVYAVPGPITSSLSTGCNTLIKQGAGIVLSLEDLLEELHLICEKRMNNLADNKIVLDNAEKLVYSCVVLSSVFFYVLSNPRKCVQNSVFTVFADFL